MVQADLVRVEQATSRAQLRRQTDIWALLGVAVRAGAGTGAGTRPEEITETALEERRAVRERLEQTSSHDINDL